MTRKLSGFFPAFLKNFDKYLLLHYPEIWATRVHFLIWSLSILGLFAVGMAYLQVDIRHLSNANDQFGMMFIPAGLVFLIWVYFAGKYNPEREFGLSTVSKRISVQAALGLGVVMLMALPYLYGFSVSYFNSSRISDRELISDINKINLVSANLTETNPKNVRNLGKYNENYSTIYGPDYLDGIVLGSNLYFDWEKLSREEKIKMIADYLRIVEKYDGWQSLRVYEPAQILDRNVQNPENLEESLRSSFEEIKWPVEKIVRAKEEHHSPEYGFMAKNSLFFAVSVIFFIWGLAMVYLKIGWGKFWVGVVSGVFLFISVVMISFIEYNMGGIHEETMAYILLGVLWVMFIVQAYFQPKSHRTNYWKTVALALSAAVTPVVPFVLLADWALEYSDAHYFFYLCIGPGVFTVLLWNTIFNDRFRKLNATPL